MEWVLCGASFCLASGTLKCGARVSSRFAFRAEPTRRREKTRRPDAVTNLVSKLVMEARKAVEIDVKGALCGQLEVTLEPFLCLLTHQTWCNEVGFVRRVYLRGEH